MLTECPSCLTVFRVTGAILKMGHGQVRCGKCRTQFDALESLLDDEEASSEAARSTYVSPKKSAQPPESSGIEAEEPAIAEEITMEGSRIEISGTYRVPSDESLAGAAAAPEKIIHEHVVIDRDQVRSYATADDEQPDAAPEDDDAVDEEQFVEIALDDGEPVSDAANHLLADTDAQQATPEPDEPLPLSQRMWKRARTPTPVQDAITPIDAELAALTRPQQPTSERSGWWTATSVMLVFALVVQVVHHYRDPLVRNPKWGGTVSRVYRALGLTLTPHWDLHAYELQQWGVISDSAARDALRVRASVTNTATFAQPYPLIRLALEDRWGAAVAMREFTPEEYLISASANRMMAPRQRANAEIVIVDPGADAVGFQIHACLLQGPGMVCSDDAAVKQ